MSTPVDDRPEPTYEHPSFAEGDSANIQSVRRQPSLPSYNINQSRERQEAPSDEEGTVWGDGQNEKENVPPLHPEKQRPRANSHLTVRSQYDQHDRSNALHNTVSAHSREQRFRMDDDLEMLKIEREVSRQVSADNRNRSKSRDGGERRRLEAIDEFDEATNPVHEQTQAYKPAARPTTKFAAFVKRVHGSNWLIRSFCYIAPPTFILLIPLLLGALLYTEATVGGVYLLWFMIWLEIVWLTLWAGRILAKALPWPIGVVSSLFTNNSKKWRDMGKQLELPATLFFWWLAIEVSFLPTMTYHQKGFKHGHVQSWMKTMNKVLVSLFVGAILNFLAKIIIQLIAISFHLRTYSDRIEINKFNIEALTKLYSFSKQKIAMDDSEFEAREHQPASGAMTPGQIVSQAAKRTKAGFSKFGDVAGKVAGDFTGRAARNSTHPYQVVLALLGSNSGSQALARRLYRTFAREETETIVPEDLRYAFENDEEAEMAFTMFDKDLNGDISMEELEAVCVEIGRERKSITASLKDLDSVVGKLDEMFMFVVFVITLLVFLSLISTSAAGVLASAGSAVLALSWLLSATAQEFLQSCIFVFVKHPLDVGDRVTIYGNTGASLVGDDYFVKEISLLYTEFKKMEGHVVQAPNSYLNTLFIMNHRRSGGLAEAVSINIKFGTTLDQIEGLRNQLLEFVTAEKREYQAKILTELRDIKDVHSLSLNVIFFYKSSWQNEGLRLARRNKFMCNLMVAIQEMGIEGPQARFPGQQQSFPFYLQNVPHVKVPGVGHSGHPNAPEGMVPDDNDGRPKDPPFVAPEILPQSELPQHHHHYQQQGQTSSSDAQHHAQFPRMRSASILRSGSVAPSSQVRKESAAHLNRRVDLSLGARSAALENDSGDVYTDRMRARIPIELTEASRERSEQRTQEERLRSGLERRESQLGGNGNAALGRTTSRDERGASQGGLGGFVRRSTDSGSRWRTPVHRNRFFGGGGGSNVAGTGMSSSGAGGGFMRRATSAAVDEESGVGMADIPESPASRTPRSPAPVAAAPAGLPHGRLDPRTGLVSPVAMSQLDGDGRQVGGLPGAGHAGAAPPTLGGDGSSLQEAIDLPVAPEAAQFPTHPVGRSQTEDFGAAGARRW